MKLVARQKLTLLCVVAIPFAIATCLARWIESSRAESLAHAAISRHGGYIHLTPVNGFFNIYNACFPSPRCARIFNHFFFRTDIIELRPPIGSTIPADHSIDVAFIKDLPQLRAISLDGLHLGIGDIQQIAECRSLICASMNSCNLSDDSIKLICQSRSLREISIADNKLTDFSANTIARSGRIRRVCVSGNMISSKSLDLLRSRGVEVTTGGSAGTMFDNFRRVLEH